MKLKVLSSKALMLGLLVLLLLIVFVFIIRRAGPMAPVRVTVVQAETSTITPALYGIGTVEARRSYLIGPTAASRVLRVLVDVGDAVKAGQLLAEMDPVDLDSRLEALNASVARAHSVVAAADAQTADTQARMVLAQTSARRYTELAQQNFVSSGAVEAKAQEQASAQAASRSAQANLLATRQDLVRLKAEHAALVQQRQNLRLVATQDGVVMSRDAEPGSTVVAGQSVIKLVDPGSLWVKARFDQARSAGLAPGLAADIVLRSNAGVSLRGKLARVELQGDSVTQERTAQIAFDALPVGISLGELAEVTLSLPGTAPSLVLPNAAIKRYDGQTGVWLLNEGRLSFAPLRLGQSSLDGQVQVLEGLKAGEQVVVYSEKEIDTNSRIEVVKSLVASKVGQGKS
jgi:HlyD family secretion protein